MSDKQMFDQVYCSQCGGSFGPGYHGYSHCSDHTESALASQQKAEPVALNIDDAECVLHESLAAAHKRGPVSDDKVLLDELAKRGVFLARCAAPLDAEGIRLLREALDWVGLDSPMFEKIDAYLAKYSRDQP